MVYSANYPPDCARKMNKLLSALFAVCVTCVTALSVQAQDVKGDAKAGEKKNAMCIGCHGIQGYQASFPEVYKVPMISGQAASYIVSALTAYQKGDRKHPTMRGIAASLSNQDMADLAAYYAASAPAVKKDEKSAVTVPTSSERVAALIARGGKDGDCYSCHGANFNKPKDGSIPKLAGQHADYLFVALKAYRTEGNPQVGRANGSMLGQASKFTNAEMKELATYIHSLPSDLATVAQPRFR